MVKLWENKKGNNFGKNVKVMTWMDHVTIDLTKCEYTQRMALAPRFDFIYQLLWFVVVYSWYYEKCKNI